MKRASFPLRAALIAAALTVFAIARALEVPFLSGRIVDNAGVLSSAAATELDNLLRAYEDSTGNQFAVLIISALDGENLEEFSHRVAETWKLGKKGVDNGALLFIAKDDRQLRIEVGYGLESSLTDAVCSFIINQEITPRFRNGDFDAGVKAGVIAMIAAADGRLDTSVKAASSDGTDVAGMLVFLLIWFIVVGIFTSFSIVSKGCMGWFLYAFLFPFYLAPAFIAYDMLPVLGVVIMAVYLIVFPLLKLLLPSTKLGKFFETKMASASVSRGRSGGWSSSRSSGWSSGGSSGWSSGGSSFSGGGGSFGGGGSSGSW